MRIPLLCLVCCFVTHWTLAQQKDTSATEEPFVVVEQQPEFPGGLSELSKYLFKNLKVKNVCRTGGPMITFVVDKTGEVKDIQVKGFCPAPEANQEVEQVIRNMPRWKPGMQSGRAVPVKFSLPIHIRPESQE